MRILYVGRFIQGEEWRTEPQVASALREWHHEVIEHQLNVSSLHRLPQAIHRQKPDLVLWTYNSQLIRNDRLAQRVFKEVEMTGVMTAAYHLDRYWDLKRESSIYTEPWWQVDLCMTADGGNQKRFEDAGVNHSWLPPAIHGPDTELIGHRSRRYRAKVAFVGSWQNYHPEWPWRMAMIEHLRKRYGDDFHTFPEQFDRPIRGQALNDLYASVDVVVGDSIFAGTPKGSRYWSDRPIETLGRGGCLVFPHVEGLEQNFRDGEHLRYFDAGDPYSMFDAIDELLDDPVQRDDLREQGRAEVKENHLYRHRANEMIQRIVEARPSLAGWTGDVREGTCDAVAIREIWYDDCYRAATHINEGDTVVDLGANVGAFAIWAAKKGAHVIAVEPIPANLLQLRKNIADMGVEDRVTVIAAGVAEKRGTIRMDYLGLDRSQSAYRCADGAIEVPVLPLDDILLDRDIAFLKVDVEGSEVHALKGVDLRRVKNIAVETHVDPNGTETTHQAVGDILRPFFHLAQTGGHVEGYLWGATRR